MTLRDCDFLRKPLSPFGDSAENGRGAGFASGGGEGAYPVIVSGANLGISPLDMK